MTASDATDFLVHRLAYYVEWHMRRLLRTPLLFDDHDHRDERNSPVEPALPNLHGRPHQGFDCRQRTTDGLDPYKASRLCSADLATLTRNRVSTPNARRL